MAYWLLTSYDIASYLHRQLSVLLTPFGVYKDPLGPPVGNHHFFVILSIMDNVSIWSINTVFVRRKSETKKEMRFYEYFPLLLKNV
jgi:hypothetical protein